MATIVWDQVGSRTYETGIDRGVIYLPNGVAVPWNGITSVTDKTERTNVPVYFDNTKVRSVGITGSYVGTLRAYTYPNELLELEGMSKHMNGLYFSTQRPQAFGLTYRTRIANDVNGVNAYKIHIFSNVVVIPSEKVYNTLSDDPNLVEFSWDLFAGVEDLPGYGPLSHFVVDSRTTASNILSNIEVRLYGNASVNPTFTTIRSLLGAVAYTWNSDNFTISVILDETGDRFNIIDGTSGTSSGVHITASNATEYTLSNPGVYMVTREVFEATNELA